jgi:hypothetical protein
MSIKLIENEIRRFLTSTEKEVVCLTGHWGVGKTFAWNRYLTDVQRHGGVALQNYSYVSLFGINSLSELKCAIFENSVKSSDIGIEPSIETLKSNTSAVVKRLGKQSSSLLRFIPGVKEYSGAIGPIGFLSVKETIVCIDDIERRGDNLEIRDVMGLVSLLKEQKRCKVMLILNDDAFDNDDEKVFRKYHEKVIDTSLTFAPSPQECVAIAISQDTNAGKLLAQNVVTLGIRNIRVIKKIERLITRIETMLSGYHDQVFRQAVHSITLFGWSVYEPDLAPDTQYLKRKQLVSFLGAKKEQKLTDREVSWNALLEASEFSHTDEFDLSLLDGIKKGFFDEAVIRKQASAQDERLKATGLDKSFTDAWSGYHDSFDENQEIVLDSIYEAFFKGIQYVSPVNLNGTVALFKELGRPEQAFEMIQQYIKIRGNNWELFDLHNYPFGDTVTDPDVISAFDEAFSRYKTVRNPTDTIIRIAETESWNPEDIALLCSLSSDDYWKIFKSHRGDDLRRIIKVCLQFDRFFNAASDMQKISQLAKEALARIAKESKINALRVRSYGITIDKNAGSGS